MSFLKAVEACIVDAAAFNLRARTTKTHAPDTLTSVSLYPGDYCSYLVLYKRCYLSPYKIATTSLLLA